MWWFAHALAIIPANAFGLQFFWTSLIVPYKSTQHEMDIMKWGWQFIDLTFYTIDSVSFSKSATHTVSYSAHQQGKLTITLSSSSWIITCSAVVFFTFYHTNACTRLPQRRSEASTCKVAIIVLWYNHKSIYQNSPINSGIKRAQWILPDGLL